MHFLYRVRCFASDQGGIRAGHSFTLSESIPKGSTQTDTKFFSSVSVFQIPYGDARTGETQRHRGHRSGREWVGGKSVKQNRVAGVDWIEMQSLLNQTLCSLCLCVSNSGRDARRGETQRHRGHRSGREWEGGNSVKQKRVQSRRSLYSTQLCALCVSVFQIPSRMRGRGNTEAQRSQIGKGMGGREQCETEKSAVETQSLLNPTLCSLCLCVSNSGRDARRGETQRHRGHRSGRERVEWGGRIMELETFGLGVASLVLRSMQPLRFPFLRNASHLILG